VGSLLHRRSGAGCIGVADGEALLRWCQRSQSMAHCGNVRHPSATTFTPPKPRTTSPLEVPLPVEEQLIAQARSASTGCSPPEARSSRLASWYSLLHLAAATSLECDAVGDRRLNGGLAGCSHICPSGAIRSFRFVLPVELSIVIPERGSAPEGTLPRQNILSSKPRPETSLNVTSPLPGKRATPGYCRQMPGRLSPPAGRSG